MYVLAAVSSTRLLTKKLIPFFEGKSEGWCSYGFLAEFEIYLPAKGAIWLNIVIGPSNAENSFYRQKVFGCSS